MAEQSLATASRIRDADVAQETASMIAEQVIQQAAAAVLAQANQQSALVLQLLSPPSKDSE
jgi:flagellin